ncbi:unnamed protein product, partial [Iphiclides podalirius]
MTETAPKLSFYKCQFGFDGHSRTTTAVYFCTFAYPKSKYATGEARRVLYVVRRACSDFKDPNKFQDRFGSEMATLEAPTRPPPSSAQKAASRPKMSLPIPPLTNSLSAGRLKNTPSVLYRGNQKYFLPPATLSRVSDHHENPFMHMYHTKASEFMFKQFEGVKDFTMSTAKSSLSVGEKFAFWFYSKLKWLSKKWFTHLFLSLCLLAYSILGAGIFATLEGES